MDIARVNLWPTQSDHKATAQVWIGFHMHGLKSELLKGSWGKVCGGNFGGGAFKRTSFTSSHKMLFRPIWELSLGSVDFTLNDVGGIHFNENEKQKKKRIAFIYLDVFIISVRRWVDMKNVRLCLGLGHVQLTGMMPWRWCLLRRGEAEDHTLFSLSLTFVIVTPVFCDYGWNTVWGSVGQRSQRKSVHVLSHCYFV